MSLRRTGYGARILWLALATGLPGTAVALLLLWTGDYTERLVWTATIVLVVAWLWLSFALRRRAIRPLQTVSNLLAALREGDYSPRTGEQPGDGDFGLVVWEIGKLGEVLREQRLGTMEMSALLRRVMAEIDVVVVAFDAKRRLMLINKAGERLLGRSARELVGQTADELDMAECLEGETPRTIEASFPGGRGRWALTRNPIRQGGLRHELVVLSNVQRALREEERQAWKRLVRVLSHEINNSLAPIQSIADSLRGRVDGDADDSNDLRRGLDVIRGRAESLGRFMAAYTRLAKLPPPTMATIDVGELVRSVARLEDRVEIEVRNGSPASVRGDRSQLEQLLINLVRNAVDAAEETDGSVAIEWSRHGGRVDIRVVDEGPGIVDTANLFVPFFTTKPEGTGIGLALSRQIADAHDGTLTLENRADTSGCVASLDLPAA